MGKKKWTAGFGVTQSTAHPCHSEKQSKSEREHVSSRNGKETRTVTYIEEPALAPSRILPTKAGFLSPERQCRVQGDGDEGHD